MPFLRPLPLHGKRHRRVWEVVEDWFPELPDGRQVHIPRGFLTDGASVPRLLWGVFSPTGRLLFPAIIHDYAIRYRHLVIDRERVPMWDHESDQLFFQLCRQHGLGLVASHLAYIGVRIGSLFRRRP